MKHLIFYTLLLNLKDEKGNLMETVGTQIGLEK
jgi:hypothetical protein